MSLQENLHILPGVEIDAACLTYSFSRSSGPGGQNVNKLNTRAGVSLNVRDCPSLNDRQKETLLRVLKNRLDKEGVITVWSQEHRSQYANRLAATDRLAELLAKALTPARVRKKTRVPRGAVEERLRRKKQRASLKRLRSETHGD